LRSGDLAGLDLFADASVEMIEALARRAVEVRFSANETIFLTGSVSRGWFIILEGTVRVVRGSRGRQHVVHTEGRGGTLGEVPLVERDTHPATAIAVVDTRCALLTADALESAIAEQPRVAFLVARRLAARVRTLVNRLDDRSARTVDGRLIDFLLALPQDESGQIVVPQSQQDLAEELGTVREVVARGLRRLHTEGIIRRVGRRRYQIPDREKLRRVGQGDDPSSGGAPL
jgi:CRP/FNR family cyclic AMP-dependent transcriptional regulator